MRRHSPAVHGKGMASRLPARRGKGMSVCSPAERVPAKELRFTEALGRSQQSEQPRGGGLRPSAPQSEVKQGHRIARRHLAVASL